MKISLTKIYNAARVKENRKLNNLKQLLDIVTNIKNISFSDLQFLYDSVLEYNRPFGYNVIPCISKKISGTKYKFTFLIIKAKEYRHRIDAIVEFEGSFAFNNNNTYKFEISSEEFPPNTTLKVWYFYIIPNDNLTTVEWFMKDSITIRRDWETSFHKIPGLSGIIYADPDDDKYVDIIRLIDYEFENLIMCEDGYGALYNTLDQVLAVENIDDKFKELATRLDNIGVDFKNLKNQKNFSRKDLLKLCDIIDENCAKAEKIFLEIRNGE